MKCRSCDSTNTRVTCTEHHGNQTKRWCRCLDCGEKFRTIECYEKSKPGPPKGSRRPGVIARGSAHGRSVLTEKNVLDIRKLARKGKTYKQISEIYGIGPSYISRIVNYKQWSHLP